MWSTNLNSEARFCSLRCKAENSLFWAKRSAPAVTRRFAGQAHTLLRSATATAKAKVGWAPSGSNGPLSSSPAPTPVFPIVPPEMRALDHSGEDLEGHVWDEPGTVTLLAVGDDQFSAATNGEQKVDTSVRLGDAASWNFVTPPDAFTTVVRAECTDPGDFVIDDLSGFGMSFFFPEPEVITDFGLWVFTRNGGRFRWSSATAAHQQPSKGWNYFRFRRNWMQPPFGNPVWGEVSAVQVYVKSSRATSFNLGQVWAETRPKASLLFIHDGGYSAFDMSPGYHDLRNRGIPVTWSIDCGLIGDPVHVTRERIIEIGNENGNSISFHGWGGGIRPAEYTSGEQARDETAKCQKWLEELPTAGNTGRLWRTAWLQNRCPYAPATNDMVKLNPMWDPANTPPRGADLWPLTRPYNYRREPIHNRSAEELRDLFVDAEQTRGVLVAYTHIVGEGRNNISGDMWAEFLRLVDQGVAEGWLECVTFEMLSA